MPLPKPPHLRYAGGLRAGQIMTTASCSGMNYAKSGDTVIARFDILKRPRCSSTRVSAVIGDAEICRRYRFTLKPSIHYLQTNNPCSAINSRVRSTSTDRPGPNSLI